MDNLARTTRLLEAIRQAQHEFILDSGNRDSFRVLLSALLSLTESEYGFIGEVEPGPSEQQLRVWAYTDISWNDATRKLLQENAGTGLVFDNLDSLFGYAIRNDQVVIANDAKNDPRAANKYLSEFARLMRGVLENSEQEFIPLQTEIQILELYLGLEHLRFQDRFEYEFSVSPELDRDSILIPPMLVQPYIENAVWHGLRYKKEKGLLSVEIYPQDQALIIDIRDNGIGRKRSAELKTHNQNQQDSTGLKNTAARLDLINTLYNQQLEINIEDLDPLAADVGTRVQIKLMLSENSLA